jgi:hypothetical protein
MALVAVACDVMCHQCTEEPEVCVANRAGEAPVVVVSIVVSQIMVLRVLLSPLLDIETDDATSTCAAFQMFDDRDGVVKFSGTAIAIEISVSGARHRCRVGLITYVTLDFCISSIGMVVVRVLAKVSVVGVKTAVITYKLQMGSAPERDPAFLAFRMSILLVVFQTLCGVKVKRARPADSMVA